MLLALSSILVLLLRGVECRYKRETGVNNRLGAKTVAVKQSLKNETETEQEQKE